MGPGHLELGILSLSDLQTWSRQFRPPLHDAPIAPRAQQSPLPVWAGVGGSPGSAARAGLLGLPMVLGYIGGPLSHAKQAVDIYRAAGERAGHPEKLRVGISTHFFAGPRTSSRTTTSICGRRRPAGGASWWAGRRSRRAPGAARPS
jgi:alkanesulfonate monooxygenase SsuD/methylene tetrahydromethanopterin reductase-like flavin-dependent oxidoreductase (luciferase family)